MQGLYLVAGHLCGDFVFQNDYLAAHKTKDSKVCALHCLIYTLMVVFFGGDVLPWWTWPLVFASHFVVDRWSLARKWMSHAGQEAFARDKSPWSVIVVDQSIHAATLAFIAALATMPLYQSLGALSVFILMASAIKDVLRRLPAVQPEGDKTDARVAEACESVQRLLGSLNEAVDAEIEAFKTLRKENTSIVVDPSVKLEDGKPTKSVRVATDLGLILDVPPSASGPRVFLPVLPGDTLEEWQDRLYVVLDTHYEGSIPSGLDAPSSLKERYAAWVADAHSCACLDHLFKPVHVLVSAEKHERMLEVADLVDSFTAGEPEKPVDGPEPFVDTTAAEVVGIYQTLFKGYGDSFGGSSDASRQACLATAWEIWKDNRDREDNARRDQAALALMMEQHQKLPVNQPPGCTKACAPGNA